MVVVFFPHNSGTSSKSARPARSQSEPQSALVESTSTTSSQGVVAMLASDWNSTKPGRRRHPITATLVLIGLKTQACCVHLSPAVSEK